MGLFLRWIKRTEFPGGSVEGPALTSHKQGMCKCVATGKVKFLLSQKSDRDPKSEKIVNTKR